MESSIIEIRKIKYIDYIDNHPHKPYGYYAMGELELMESSYDVALNYFVKALSLDEHYARAKTGYLLCLLHEGQYVQAIRFFQKNMTDLKSKTVLFNDLLHGITSDYPLTRPNKSIPVGCRAVDLKGKLGKVRRLYRKYDNPVAGALLALHYKCKPNKLQERFLVDLYMNLIQKAGIVEALRWHLVNRISKKEPAILQNRSIASLFRYYPDHDMSTEYANFILTEALIGQNQGNAKGLLHSAAQGIVETSIENKWLAVSRANRLGEYDAFVMACCVALIRNGWVDQTVSDAFNTMVERGMTGYSSRDTEILRLFGYPQNTSVSV